MQDEPELATGFSRKMSVKGKDGMLGFEFHREHLNPYVNFHRPCAIPKILTAANGKRRRIYLRWATPFEMFRELPGCEKHLRPRVTLGELDRFAKSQSDTEAALAMQGAKRKLFQSFQQRNTA